MPVAQQQIAPDAVHALTGFGRRKVAPLAAFGGEFVVKRGEHCVLEGAALTGIEFELHAFLGAKSTGNEKFEWAGREIFQGADRRAKLALKKQFDAGGRESWVFCGSEHLPGFRENVGEFREQENFRNVL